MAPVQNRRYLIVSPVKDEGRYVERTLRSVAAQTVLPIRWILVDDGSSDETPAILARHARDCPWITVVTRRNGELRQPGSSVMNAFYCGLERAASLDFDYIVKLDCDVELPRDYFERLFEQFERDPQLGIASGVYLEEGARGWHPIAMPDYHAAGASKVIRAPCFAAIGGFVRDRGWDTVDEVRAQVRGWRTRHFSDLRFRHLKREGSGIGRLRSDAMHGDVYFLTGGGPLFLLFKVVHRMIAGRPPLIGGLAMLLGYVRSWISGRERLVSPAEAQHYRRLLNQRLVQVVRGDRSGELDSLKPR